MKKISFIMSLAAIITLAGCDSSSSEPTSMSSVDDVSSTESSLVDSSSTGSSDDVTSSSTGSSSSEVEVTWSNEELAIMSEHLGDFVLPYLEMDDYDLYYDATNECVSIEARGVEVSEYVAVMDEAGYVTAEENGEYYYIGYFEYRIEIYIYLDEHETLWVDAYPTVLLSTSEALDKLNAELTSRDYAPYPYSMIESDKILVNDNMDQYGCMTMEVGCDDAYALIENYKATLEGEGATVEGSSGSYLIYPTSTSKMQIYANTTTQLIIDYYPHYE